MAETLGIFRAASKGLRGEEALRAMGLAYRDLVVSDRTRLLGQLQAYAACEDADVQAAMRRGYGELFRFVEAVADNRGVSPARVLDGFGRGDVLIGAAAVAAGMADGLGSFESVLAQLVAGRPVSELRRQGVAAFGLLAVA